MTFNSGAKVKGQWKNGKLNGKASFLYCNGDVYDGNWVENIKSG